MSDSMDRGYVIKADVANFFGSVNQHTLVNHLEAIGYPAPLRNALDAFLVLLTGDRNSRGIIQGVFPSDLFGNFYLNPIDEYLKDLGPRSVRYVDDIYILVSSLTEAEETTRALTLKLRDYDLELNEGKTKLLHLRSLTSEELDLEKLFSDALKERADRSDEDDEIGADYGFQSEWEDEEVEAKGDDIRDPELSATEALFNNIAAFPSHVEKIERFCLPLFAAAGSDYAVDHVISNFSRHPTMSQIYCSYLAKFRADRDVSKHLEKMLVATDIHYDWQRMWILAALMIGEEITDSTISSILRMYKDGANHEALRAVGQLSL